MSLSGKWQVYRRYIAGPRAACSPACAPALGSALRAGSAARLPKIIQDRDCSLIARLPWYCPAAGVPAWHYAAPGLGGVAHISSGC